jgi:hypothetical protein
MGVRVIRMQPEPRHRKQGDKEQHICHLAADWVVRPDSLGPEVHQPATC